MPHVVQIATKQGEQGSVDTDQQQGQLTGFALRTQPAAVALATDGGTVDADYRRQLLLGQAQLLTAVEQRLEQDSAGVDIGFAERTHDRLTMSVCNKISKLIANRQNLHRAAANAPNNHAINGGHAR